jgi:hypothetical protein
MPRPCTSATARIWKPWARTPRRPSVGHSLVQALSVVAGRRCPREPQLYRQKAVCEAEGVGFASKGDRMAERIRTCEPAADTHTHVLLDRWYSARRIWAAAKARGLRSSSGLKSNRSIRITDGQANGGWRRQDLKTCAGKLSENDYPAGAVAQPGRRGARGPGSHRHDHGTKPGALAGHPRARQRGGAVQGCALLGRE